MIFTKRYLPLFFTVLFSSVIHAELLIVKKVTLPEGKTRFAAPDATDDKAMAYISQILLKYQWPMVIMSDLTEKEKGELLTPGIENGEEIFIQKKIDETLKSDVYQVVFIPTALYELFCINDLLLNIEKSSTTTYWDAVKKAVKGVNGISIKFDFLEILTEKNALQKIFNQYATINELFFGKPPSAVSYINEKIVTYLIKELPGF